MAKLSLEGLYERIAKYPVTKVKALYREYGNKAKVDHLLDELIKANRIYHVTPETVRAV
jgi:hypothetical protein